MPNVAIQQRDDGFWQEILLVGPVTFVGVKDGVNLTFVAPDGDKFIHDGEQSIVGDWNGRELRVDRDFEVSESGGVGTGYDTVKLVAWAAVPFLPRATDELTFKYYRAPGL